VSRAQRHVFLLNRHSIDEKTLARFDHLNSKECKIPGKSKEINSIINSYVSRSSDWKAGLTVKDRSIQK
ncbi:unnamed protein product, partial [Prorocentrum cordatum]